MDWEVLSEIIVALLHFFDGIKVQSRRRQFLQELKFLLVITRISNFVRQLNLPYSPSITVDVSFLPYAE